MKPFKINGQYRAMQRGKRYQIMIGIYSITDNLTGNMYIGKSTDIKRRFTEHKTPKARGNDRLHKDIQEKGIENFTFSVLEECNIDDLNLKELQYIKIYQPFYNTVGKNVSDETKKRISDGTKTWWNNLPEHKKQSIIKKNLTGHKKGYIVSDETKRKISESVSKVQKQKVRCIETQIVFDSVGAFERAVGAYPGACSAYWKGKIKTVKGYHVEKCRD